MRSVKYKKYNSEEERIEERKKQVRLSGMRYRQTINGHINALLRSKKWREKNSNYGKQDWLINKEKRQKKRRETQNKRKLEVFNHYGGSKCACCGETIFEFLTIDHINGGGSQHRKEIGGLGHVLYRWLIKNNFPDGFQILCYNCNCAKGHFGTCPHKKEV